MDEHPKDWWEVSTTSDSCFRINEQTAQRLRDVLRNYQPGMPTGQVYAVDVVDIYGCDITLAICQIDAIWHVGEEMRKVALLRGLLMEQEKDAFDKEHEVPEWERS